jgi:hypothetical protein
LIESASLAINNPVTFPPNFFAAVMALREAGTRVSPLDSQKTRALTSAEERAEAEKVRREKSREEGRAVRANMVEETVEVRRGQSLK